MGTIKKNDEKDENGQLSAGIYSSPAAARSPLQGWVSDRSIAILKRRNQIDENRPVYNTVYHSI